MNRNKLKGYVPIDYSLWDSSGQGSNIIHLMNSTEVKLWDSVLRYQDKRDDKGHAENVTYFAIRLLDYFEAERRIIIPAAILHDTGWSQMTKEELEQFYLSNWKEYEPALRKRHQEEGVKLANKLLSKIKYPKKSKKHILEIISQHDTRKEFFSKEDGVMRDADKLWRYTLPHLNLYLEKRKTDKKFAYDFHIEKISEKGFFYSDIAKEIAKLELDNAIRNYDNRSIISF